MIAIWKREFISYMNSVIGFLFMAVILFFTGLYFTVYNVFSGYPYVSYALSSAMVIFVIAIPVLTMRCIAEERKNKTDQLTLTAPVTVGKIVLGKFFALESIFTIPVIVVCLYPLVMSGFGTVPMAESYVSILSFYLYGTLCIAVGIFISSLTESQVIAAVVSVAFLFIGYVMSGICNLISQTGNFLTKILSCFDLTTRFSDLTEGNLEISSVIYFLTVTALFLFLTTQSIQKRRYSISVKHLSFGAYNTTLTVIVLAVTVFINLLVGEIPDKYTSFDITTNKLYSLSDDTKDFVKNINSDITIYALSKKDSMDTTIKKTLEKYEDLNSHIKVEYVDPTINPKFYTQYTEEQLSAMSLIVTAGDKNKAINYNDLYETQVDYQTYQQNTTGYDGEGQITSALTYVTSENSPKVYFLTGHGETELETDFTAAVSKINADSETINLLKYDAVPEDADFIVLNGPTSDLSKDDLDKITAYLNKGGNIMIVTGDTEENLSNFNSLLDYFGIIKEEGMVVEQNSDNFYQNQLYLFPNVEYDEVTSKVSNAYLFMPYASGLISKEGTENLEITPLLTTSDSAFSRVDIANNTSAEKQDNDIDGPFNLAVKAVRTLDSGTSTALIYGSPYLFTDNANQMVSSNNMKLFTSSMSSLMKVEEAAISIPVKEYNMDQLTFTAANMAFVAILCTVIVPVSLIVIGLILWLKRRKA